MDARTVARQLELLGTPERAKNSAWFFKTGPGQYGEGDIFWGITVPEQRKIAKTYKDLPLGEVIKLLHSPIHECRLTALLIWVSQYQNGTATKKLAIYKAYLANTRWVNNWDLVDTSAHKIIGPQLGPNYKSTLTKLARSSSLWEKRIAVIACFYYIKLGDPKPAFYIIDILKYDQNDLIQKAVGWMLREIGKACSREILLGWLLTNQQYTKLPRTTLRYAIEHFDQADRKAFLSGRA
ncbi:MAG: DNA alkylation repair protein [Candidatus Saccharimonadales bacterium]